MTIRVRPKRFGTNQNYIQRNKKNSAHTNAPMVGNTKTVLYYDDVNKVEIEISTESGNAITK